MRVLKTQAAGPPHPGRNRARREFWLQMQQLVLALGSSDDGPPAVGANLLLDWDVTREREIVVALSKPMGIWKYRGQPKLEWRRTVVLEEGSMPRFIPAEEDVAVTALDLTEVSEDNLG